MTNLRRWPCQYTDTSLRVSKSSWSARSRNNPWSKTCCQKEILSLVSLPKAWKSFSMLEGMRVLWIRTMKRASKYSKRWDSFHRRSLVSCKFYQQKIEYPTSLLQILFIWSTNQLLSSVVSLMPSISNTLTLFWSLEPISHKEAYTITIQKWARMMGRFHQIIWIPQASSIIAWQ